MVTVRFCRERPGSAPLRWYNLPPMDIAALQGKLREFAAELLRLAEQASIPLHDDLDEKTHVLVDWENVQPDETDCRGLVPDATDVGLFHGPNQKNIGRGYETFGERVVPVRIARTGKNALDFHLSFYIGYIAGRQVKTITLDNGTEFHDYERVERASGVKFYFATPYHSWELRTNENTNGLIRQYLPKGTCLRGLEQRHCNSIATQLNNRPRLRLDFKTPREVLARS